MNAVLECALGVVPAALAWMVGRWALAADSEERFRRVATLRGVRGFLFMGPLIVAGELNAFVFQVTHVLVFFASWYPLERALYGGPPGLLRSLTGRLRRGLALLFATGMPYLVLVWLVVNTGPAAFGVAVLVVAVAYLWPLPILFQLLGARPIARDTLREPFAAVESRLAHSPPVNLETSAAVDPIHNAFFLAQRTRSYTIFGHSLLDALTPAEAAAIHAHELAHLEQYGPERLRKLVALMGLQYFLALLPTLLGWIPAVAEVTFLSLPVRAGIAFIGIIALGFARRASSRIDEAGADRRAVVLCGDPDALVSALVKLHALNGIPTQVPATADALATHPSLARRIQGIREAAEAAGHEAPPHARERFTLRGRLPGERVCFDEHGVTVFSGVPGDATDDPASLADVAAEARSTRWSHLFELLFVPDRRGGSITFRRVDGTKGTVKLEPGTADPTRRLHPWLEALGPIPADLAARTLFRPVLAFVLAASVAPGFHWLAIVALPAIRAIDAAGARGVAAAIVAQLLFVATSSGVQWSDPPTAISSAVLVLGGLLGIPAALAIQPSSMKSIRSHAAPFLIGAAFVLPLLPLLSGSLPPGFPLWAWLHDDPSPALLLACAAIASTASDPPRRLQVAALAVLSGALLGGGTVVVRDKLVTDALLPPPPVITAREHTKGTPIDRVGLDASRLEVSPGGTRWLASVEEDCASPSVLVGRPAQATLRVAGSFGAFVDEGRVLTVGVEDGEALIRLWRVDGAEETPIGRRTLGTADAPSTVTLDRGQGRWTAILDEYGSSASMVTGDVELAEEPRIAPIDKEGRVPGELYPRPDGALLVRAAHWARDLAGWQWKIGYLLEFPNDFGSTYELRDRDGNRPRLESALHHTWSGLLPGGAIVVVDGRSERGIWHWDGTRTTPVASLSALAWPIAMHDSGLLTAVHRDRRHVELVDVRSSGATRIDTGPAGGVREAVGAPGGLFVLRCGNDACVIEHHPRSAAVLDGR